VLYKGFTQPWRGWLLALSAVIFALIIVQFAVGGSWPIFGIVLVLIAIQFALARYARRQMQAGRGPPHHDVVLSSRATHRLLKLGSLRPALPPNRRLLLARDSKPDPPLSANRPVAFAVNSSLRVIPLLPQRSGPLRLGGRSFVCGTLGPTSHPLTVRAGAHSAVSQATRLPTAPSLLSARFAFPCCGML
jgi:hypothetical protein